MPDHLHVLLVGTRNDAAFLPFMTLLRQRTAIAFRREFHERLWQDGYFDRLLRPQEITSQIVQYILNNPVRAGLVENREDYPFLGGSRRPRSAELQLRVTTLKAVADARLKPRAPGN